MTDITADYEATTELLAALAAPEATPEAAPSTPRLTVRRKSSTVEVIDESVREENAQTQSSVTVRTTDTESGPVQGSGYTAEPREINEIIANGVVITEVRF